MKNIKDLLEAYGVSIPEDKKADFEKDFSDNYKTVAEFDKKIGRLETERDGYKEQLSSAQETLKGFEGIDIKDLQAQLDAANQKATDAENEFNRRMADRDFDEALKTSMDGYKFSSNSAKDAVMGKIKGAGLKCVDGKILGLGDLIESIKTSDAGAFVDDEEDPPAKFTSSLGTGGGQKYTSRKDIMKIKDPVERQKAIASNMSLFTE